VPEIRTDICSACHPFYTGEQRIVDTEGQVDRFLKRLQIRDTRRAEAEARTAALTSPDAPISEFDIGKRYITILNENGINVVGDFIAKLEAGGDEALLEIPGIGRKVVSDLKKMLRARGYELPKATEAAE
jgi:large subunit ribosomal protein L31